MPNKGFNHSSETKLKMSRSRKGLKRPPFSSEWKANISAANKGKRKPRVIEIGCLYCPEKDPLLMVKDGRNYTGFSRICRKCESLRLKTKIQNKHFVKSYGLTLGQVEEIYRKQNGLCALCFRPVAFPKRHISGVDHCHKNKQVRGIIHYKCNIILGMAEDQIEILELAAAYLKRFKSLEVSND